MREIAAESGFAKATLYHYFRSKQELAIELYRRLSEDLAEQESWIIGTERGTPAKPLTR